MMNISTLFLAGIVAVSSGLGSATPIWAEPVGLTALAQGEAFDQVTLGTKSARQRARAAARQNARRLWHTPPRAVRLSGPVQRHGYQSWMNPEIRDAWDAGYRGQGSTITVLDDFSGSRALGGNLGAGEQRLRHGEWVWLHGAMLAPAARVASRDFTSVQRVRLAPRGLNIANLSYGMFAQAGHEVNQIGWSARERSIISHARTGAAVIAKAAGNDAVAIGDANRAGNTDYLSLALVGAGSAIFVGALDQNGTPEHRAQLASYSNFAGDSVTVQNQFLTVGVRGDVTGLRGTSFAAPVVSGYAAVLGSKFRSASPTQISNRLLDTARTDTIEGYSAALHGRGEASIARALAPTRIR